MKGSHPRGWKRRRGSEDLVVKEGRGKKKRLDMKGCEQGRKEESPRENLGGNWGEGWGKGWSGNYETS